jgi:CheY-like chemotaxis protein/anti-sigma regulatory factor (Ser/Thr protein kinase)
MRQRAKLVDQINESRPVLASAARLEQVFVNLLVNAAQAIPEGRPSENEIIVSVHDRGRHVVVEVSDTGEGIPEELRDRVFDPFFTTKPRGTGTGLGLPISHSIVASYGGEISVNSVVKRGTTFRVTLPVFAGVLRSRSLTPPPGPVRTEQPRFRLLVVDDEPLVADMLERTLEENHEVTIATDANKALELLLETTFDLVFCDLLMPGKSGMDLYEEVRQKRPGVEAKLVFMTGGAFTPRASQFLATVPNRTIVKPFDLTEIERVIAHHARRADHPKSV